jgi:hypothetical protein
MAIATKHWSLCHTDDDVFYTGVLIVYSPTLITPENKEDILCYFCFLSIGAAIPMQNMDILVFN